MTLSALTPEDLRGRVRTSNLSSGDKVATALLTLDRRLSRLDPALFAEVSVLLHSALNGIASVEMLMGLVEDGDL